MFNEYSIFKSQVKPFEVIFENFYGLNLLSLVGFLLTWKYYIVYRRNIQQDDSIRRIKLTSYFVVDSMTRFEWSVLGFLSFFFFLLYLLSSECNTTLHEVLNEWKSLKKNLFFSSIFS